jgi:hypothetical protein
MTAFIYYEDTEEKETANLEELIGEGQIAFSEYDEEYSFCIRACHDEHSFW